MKTILDAKVAMMPFTHTIDFNLNRKSHNDPYFIGSYSGFFNHIMKHLNLNASLVKSNVIGTCYSNGTCNGFFSLLLNGQADFSLLSLPYQFAPGVHISTHEPVAYGPFSNVDSMKMLSLPIKNQRVIQMDALQIYEDTSLFVYFIFFSFFFTSYILLNWPFNNKRSKNISFFSLVSALLNNKLIPRQRFVHSTIVLWSFFLFIFFLVKIINGSVNSDLMKVFPEKYYETLDELIDDIYLGKSHVIGIKNYRAHSAISGRREFIFKKLLVKLISNVNTFAIPTYMVNNQPTVFIGFKITSEIQKALFCGTYNSHYFQLDQSEPFLSYQQAYAMSHNISWQLRRRIYSTFNSIFESDLLSVYHEEITTKSIGLVGVPKTTLYNCRSKLEIEKFTKKQVNWPRHIDLETILILFNCLLYFYSVSLTIFIGELSLDSVLRKYILVKLEKRQKRNSRWKLSRSKQPRANLPFHFDNHRLNRSNNCT